MRKSKLRRRLIEAENRAHQLFLLKCRIEGIEKVINILKQSTNYTFTVGKTNKLQTDMTVRIFSPYEDKEQAIINNFKNDLLKFYANQKRRLTNKANKI